MQSSARESLVLYFRDRQLEPGPPLPEFGHIARAVRRFADSPEGRAHGEVRFVEFFLELAHLHRDADETSLSPEIVRDVVFDLIPRYVTVPASESSLIVAELRFFFLHLARELGSDRHFACAHALDGDADDRLAAALADPTRFAVAKAAVMAGLDHGYDVHTVEGLLAWLASAAPEHPRRHRHDDRARRARRKSQRAARMRNR